MASEWEPPSSISAADIADRQFALHRRGYDPEEVHRFLGEVAERMAWLEDEIRRQRADAELLERRSSAAQEAAYGRLSRQVSDVIRAAEESAAAIRAEAEAEAASIIERAHRGPDRMWPVVGRPEAPSTPLELDDFDFQIDLDVSGLDPLEPDSTPTPHDEQT